MITLFRKAKDGGTTSSVTGHWLVELKRFFSIVLLRFDGLSREAFHNHAFDSVSWVLSGGLRETMLDGSIRYHWPSLRPFKTTRADFHKVDSVTDQSWVLSFRGPWLSTWQEYRPDEGAFVLLGSGRRELARAEVNG